MSSQLQTGVLLTHRGEGHTIYAQGDSCSDKAVNAYLLDLTAPAAGTSCGTGAPPPGNAPTETPRQAGTPAADSTPNAGATARPEAPGAPDTGDAKDDGSTTILLVAMAMVFAAVAVAVAVVMFQRR